MRSFCCSHKDFTKIEQTAVFCQAFVLKCLCVCDILQYSLEHSLDFNILFLLCMSTNRTHTLVTLWNVLAHKKIYLLLADNNICIIYNKHSFYCSLIFFTCHKNVNIKICFLIFMLPCESILTNSLTDETVQYNISKNIPSIQCLISA